MRELTFVAPGKLEWHEVADPKIDGLAQAIVRPIAVATCDLDTLLLRGEAPMFGGGFPLGHESVAEVVEVGDGVTGFKRGDRVVPSFQISCGSCDRCRRGLTGNCERVRGTAMYGIGALGGNFGGALSDLMKIPYADAMLVPMPDGVAPADVASSADNIPDAWRTVAPHLVSNPGAPVLIVGGGSIGLYAVQLALACGSSHVDYIDDNPGRLRLASELGATVREGPPPRRMGPYPITVAACATHEGLLCAIRSTAPSGVCTNCAIHPGETTPMPLFDMYITGMTFITGRGHPRTVIPRILELARTQKIRPARVTSKVVGWDDAIPALLDPPTKLVIARDSA
jgi:threonine dehydrogenase-like Zn-dependent dehydrogenase